MTPSSILPFEELATSILAAAKLNLQTDGCLIPMVFIVPRSGPMGGVPMSFDGPAEKRLKYGLLYEVVLPTNPKCIITLNDTYMKKYEKKDYKSESLAAAKAAGDSEVGEGIALMVHTPEHNWGITCTYTRSGDTITFDPETVMRNESGAELGGSLGPPPWGKGTTVAN